MILQDDRFAKYKKILKKRSVVEILFILVFILQFAVIIYFNLKLLGNHMGYDSSWSYLKAALMWKEKTLHNSIIWSDQTSVFLDSSMLLAALFFGLTRNLLLSYGLANITVLVCVLFCMYSIMNILGIDNVNAKWCALNLIICPYLANGFRIPNDLGYFNDMLSGPAFYSLRVLIIMLIVREYLIIKKNNKIDIWGYLALPLCFLAGISSGIFIVVMILLPYTIFIIEMVFIKNTWNCLAKLEAIYAYIAIVFVFCGKFFANHVLGIVAIDASRTWTALSKLYTNFGAPLQGLLKLLGALPIVEGIEIPVLSIEGVFRLFPLFIFAVIVLSILFVIKQLKKGIDNTNESILFLLNIVLINYLVFGLFNVQYGDALFEERYLISTFMIIIIFVAYYIQNARAELIFTQVVLFGLLISLLANNLVSDRRYIRTTNDYYQMAEIKEIVDAKGAELIYFWGDDLLCVGRSMRVYDLEHIYKNISDDGTYHHWGDYLYLEDASDYEGKTLLIVPNNLETVPEKIMKSYALVDNLNEVSIYESPVNAIDCVTGITDNISVDYPSSIGVFTEYGEFDGSSFVSDGTMGCIMQGSDCITYNGNYNFTIEYSIIEGSNATFDLIIDGENAPGGNVDLASDKVSATIANISLVEGHFLRYRVCEDEGTKIRINRIIITRNE